MKSAILESASKGFIDDEVLVHNEENYGFFIKDSNVFFKSKLEVEKTLSKLTNEKIKSCLDNFEQVSHSSHVVELNDINSTIFLYEESVFLEVSLNTSVTIEETSLLKKDFSLRLSYPLLRYYSLLDEFVEEQKYSDFFLISLLVEKLTQNNVNYIISYAGDNTIVVYLSLPDSVEEFNKELIMRFALK